MMVGVVSGGTASRLGIPGVTVAGKTGTAQTGRRHVARVDRRLRARGSAPRRGGRHRRGPARAASEATGGRVAAPIARAVLQAALDLPAPGTGP